MAERLRSSRRRVLPAVVILVAVALTGCTGGGIDPAVQFDPIDAPLPDELATELEAVLDQAVLLSGSSGGVAGVWAPWAGEWSAASGTVGPANPDVFRVAGAHSPALRSHAESPPFFGDAAWFARFDPLTQRSGEYADASQGRHDCGGHVR